MLSVPIADGRAGLLAEREMRDLVRFVPRMSPRYMAPAHLAPLLRRFELAVDGIPQRVCCSAPPRHAKSESVFHVPAFTLRRRPDWTLSYSTYGERLSRKGSRKSRAICTTAGIATEGNVNEWRTADGGGLLAGGVGGPLTGFGVNLAIVDDPTKNRLEAESATYRDRLMDWFRDVLMTRIEPGGSVFIFATRWHPDDLIGQLVADEGFEYINMPALGREVGGVRIPDTDGTSLWPERWPTEAMRARFEEVGEYTAASLYQGQPRARGERVFGDPHVWAELPLVYRAAGGVDGAYSQRTTADFSAFVKMVRNGDRYYVTEARRQREPAPQFQRRLWLVHQQEPTMRWRWYVATSEMGAASFFAEGEHAVPLKGEIAKADKFIRAMRYAAAWNAGKVMVPASAAWLNDFLAEHASFTGINDKRDDLIDAAVAAFDELQGGETGSAASAPAPRERGMSGM